MVNYFIEYLYRFISNATSTRYQRIAMKYMQIYCNVRILNRSSSRSEYQPNIVTRKNSGISAISTSDSADKQFKYDCSRILDLEIPSMAFHGRREKN